MEEDIINFYREQVLGAKAKANKFKKLANLYSLLRLGVFALTIAAITTGAILDNFTFIAASTVLMALAFAWLVARQSRFEEQRNYFDDLVKVNENEIDSILNYGNLYNNGIRYHNDKHFYTADLDIFGEASLYKLINRGATAPGNDKLASWLSAPANKATILARQEAIKEIRAKNTWKTELQTLLLFAKSADANQLVRLSAFLASPLKLPGENWLKKYCRIAPYLFITAVVMAILFPALKALAILLGLGNLGLVASKAAYIKKADLVAGKIGDTLGRYAKAFKKVEAEEWESAYCAGLFNRLKQGNTSEQINELSHLINKLNYTLNMLVGLMLNLVFIWSIKQIIAIEEWKRTNRQNLQDAFDVLAEFEALMSLASLHINYRHWTIPQIADGECYTLSAKSITHPLIPAGKRIENDYHLENAFKIDIITGSNMAGKSTFLRTLGINTVLALCGAPVCAGEMEVSVITLMSYMRIKDSLNESTSTFKAELDRLQMLLAAVEHEPKVFFLIDEMLRGTNSVDKYRGSKAVIEQLIAKRGVGLVATHDLQIARLEDKYPEYVRNFHFDIQVQQGEMLFDYKLKHGECNIFNASLLLKQIGINVE
ncbi:DNA mismatch repair protein MutS [Mucilaginibacter hurinus]|uniref:DNA mismatch repair protein MutS n=1 Tax=Mucilaginibacter hurinus TaxID=2201324 RepID=A0A367GJQ9_9SPHI|nr:DNA mismatch repair protein MutS [Mucilaginibacter hurinus]RCH53692.1 DNA mismatch repair protein MutS [Mucilaginibacter hurinus]